MPNSNIADADVDIVSEMKKMSIRKKNKKPEE